MKCISCYLLVFLAFSCAKPKSPEFHISSIATPSAEDSLTPRLFTSSNGKTYLSWLERKGEKTQLKYSQLDNAQWSTPKLISEGDNWFINWADFPSFIENEGTLSAHWLQKRAEGTYDYDIRIAQSADNGNNWSESFIPHKDNIAAEHGFVTMRPISNNQNFATWLDGRNTKIDQDHEADGHGSGGAMTIRAGIFDKSGKMTSDWELDARTCDCCQTAAAFTSKGPIVAYRDRSDDEIRDIYVTRLVDDSWTDPKPVFNDNWKISGCPVNGPSLSANGKFVALTWFTAAKGFGEVKIAFSQDAGENFGKPTVIGKGNTNGRVGTTILDNGNIAVSWMETSEDMASIMLAVFNGNGEEIIRETITKTSAARASGFPVITNAHNHIVLAWTETGETSQVKTSTIAIGTPH